MLSTEILMADKVSFLIISFHTEFHISSSGLTFTI